MAGIVALDWLMPLRGVLSTTKSIKSKLPSIKRTYCPVTATRPTARLALFGEVIVLLLCLSVVTVVTSFGQASKDSNVVEVEAYASHLQIHPGQSFQVAIVGSVKPGFHINSHRPMDEFLVPTAVQFDESKDVAFDPVDYPEPQYKSFSFSNKKMAVYAGNVEIFSRGRLSEDISPGDIQISGVLNYQACNDQSCFMPTALRFEIPLRVVKTSEPVKLINGHVFQQKSSFTSDEIHAKKVIERGLGYAVIAFFLFGLALNLTPCVYPVIPITVAFFAAQSEQRRSRIFVLASYYVVGIAVVFSVLGLVSALAGRQWGFLFQNPWFVVLISIMILCMAAGMFGAFELSVPSSVMTRFGKSRQGSIGSLIMGLTAGVVIAPCAAGIIVGLVGVVAKLGIVAKGTLLFFVMGLGLGLPYLLLAMSSGLVSRMPKSGVWMVWIRKLFGVLLIGVAIYFLVPQGKLIDDQQGFYLGVLGIFGGLLLGFLEHQEGYGRTFKAMRAILGCLLIFGGAFLVERAIHPAVEAIDWVHYTNQSIEQLQEKHRPILMEFYADWCAACKELERKTFDDDRVVEKSKAFTMVRVDCTSRDKASQGLIKRFKVTGFPATLFFSPKGKEFRSLTVLGFLEADELLKRMDRAASE